MILNKKITALTLSACLLSSFAFAKDENKKTKEEGYEFTTVKELPHTPIKDQNRSGTCWSFSTVSFIESEMLRAGKPEVDLSEMFVVRHIYKEKAEKYVRMHGNLTFGAGAGSRDVPYVIQKYGIVPEEAYTGLQYGEDKHVHGEMDEMLLSEVKTVVENKNRKLSTAWPKVIDGTLDAYLGKLPAKFEYKGKEYTPQTFASDYVGLNMDDYVEITSYTHHPFYKPFILEIPDNWLWGESYNVPMEDMMTIINNAIDNDYTVAWGSDVSEKGFATKKQGVAVIPEADTKEMSNAEISKWENMSKSEKDAKLYKLDKPGKEKTITQEMRQEAFDNYQTTDDHGMEIIGTAKDQNGTPYYIIKNSWGEYNKFKGYFYASVPFVAYKTMSIMVNKNAIPSEIRQKLGL
ncbi:MAG: aminopeptidase C [Mangrovibacterium sp.]